MIPSDSRCSAHSSVHPGQVSIKTESLKRSSIHSVDSFPSSTNAPPTPCTESPMTKTKNLFMQPLLDVADFFRHSRKQFSTMQVFHPSLIDVRFLVIIGTVYFLQGFRNYAFGDGVVWYFRQFGLSPGDTQLYQAIVLISWNVKMMYGLVFDHFPIFHRHHQPYIILASLFQLFGFVVLGIPSLSPNADSACFYYFIALMGMAMSDVVVDAMVVKQARDAGQKGGANLQSFCWIMMLMGSIAGRPTAGTINQSDGTGSRFLAGCFYSATALVALVVSFFVREEPGKTGPSLVRFIQHIGKLTMGILFNKKVVLPMSWIFISTAMVPEITAATTYWKLDVLHFGADKQSYVETCGDVFSIIGLLIYAKWLKAVPFRKMFFASQMALSLFIFLDVVLVARWNQVIYIPDIPFLVIISLFIQTMKILQAMPFLVMAAQLCPRNLEASYYATLCSIANAGGVIAVRWGGSLLDIFHIKTSATKVSQDYNYDQFTTVLWIRFALSVIPSVLVWMMVPNVAEIDAHGEEEEEPGLPNSCTFGSSYHIRESNIKESL